MTNQTILITGSGGKIGRYLLNELKNKGYLLRALFHKSELVPENKSIDFFKGDLLNPESCAEALKGVSTVIHAAGITHTNNKDLYYRINSSATRQLLKLCRTYGVKRFIFLSTRAISADGGHYSRSKIMAEKYVQESGLNWVILRLGEIYGTESNRGIDALISRIDRFTFIPVPGNGQYTLMPIYIRDAVSSIVKVLENEYINNRTYTIAGPEVISYDALIDRILAVKGTKKIKIRVPIILLRTLFYITASIKADTFFLKDQLPRLICKKSDDISPAVKELSFNPSKMKDTPVFSLQC